MDIQLHESAQKFGQAINELKKIVDINISLEGLVVKAEISKGILSVSKNENDVVISYGKTCEFFRGLLLLLEHKNEKCFYITEHASFGMNGEMVDNSRDSVITLEAAKRMVMYLAMLGLNSLLLYNEDTIEIEGHPYFGYMRMRHTQKELKELCLFADQFGVEIVPCIQVLAHLNQALRWSCYSELIDFGDILMIGEEKTYRLIEDIISGWRDCVGSHIINIGMDEAFQVGLGKYLQKNGYRPAFELMCEHLERVIQICKKYDFQPMMWSDMFFQAVFGSYYTEDKIDSELIAKVPKEVILCYWDYYTLDDKKYDRMFEKHQEIGNEISFAGGAWKWSGVVPIMDHSHKATKLGLQAAKRHGVSKVFTTGWGEHGDAASIFNILPNMVLCAECDYSEGADDAISRKLELLTGYTLEEFFKLSKPNHTPTNNESCFANPPKYLFLQDILMGLFDCHVNSTFPIFFAECGDELEVLAQRNSPFAYLFETIGKFSEVLELKCCMGVWLKEAYDHKDIPRLEELAQEYLPELIQRIEVYHKVLRKQWFKESKTGGFDVQDIFIGGVKTRIEATIYMIEAYLSGEISLIEELEQERLPFDCKTEEERGFLEVSNHGCNAWNFIVSPNITAQFCYN